MGFQALTFARSLRRFSKSRATDLVVIEGHLISQSHMDVLRPVVLTFFAKTSDSTRPRMIMPEHTKISFAITMLCALTGQCAHQTCLLFEHVHAICGQRLQRIVVPSRNPSLSM